MTATAAYCLLVLRFTTDSRFTLHEMQPSMGPFKTRPSKQFEFSGGDPSVKCQDPVFCIRKQKTTSSCIIVRSAGHKLNISGGQESYVPPNLLHGLVPTTLLQRFRFWADEGSFLRGYPMDEDAMHMIVVEFKQLSGWRGRPRQAMTTQAGASYRLFKLRAAEQRKLFAAKKGIAALIEGRCLLQKTEELIDAETKERELEKQIKVRRVHARRLPPCQTRARVRGQRACAPHDMADLCASWHARTV